MPFYWLPAVLLLSFVESDEIQVLILRTECVPVRCREGASPSGIAGDTDRDG